MKHLPPGFIPEEDLPASVAAAAPGPPAGFVPEASIASAPAQQEASVETPSTFQGITDAMMQGLTAGYADEAGAGVLASSRALFNVAKGKSPEWVKEYQGALGEINARAKAFGEESPWIAGASEVGGAVASLPGLGAKFIAKAPTYAGKLLRSAPVGGGIGAVYGAGKAEGGLGERAMGAATGAAMGTALAPVTMLGVSGVAKIVEVGARLIPNAAKREAAIKIAQALWRDNITVQQAQTRLRQIGANAIIADISENVRNLAGAAARIPGKTRDVASRVLNQRQRQQHKRISEYTRRALGAEGGYNKRIVDIQDARATAAQPLYDKAYAAEWAEQGVNYTPQDLLPIIESAPAKRLWATARRMVESDKVSGRAPADYNFPKLGDDVLPDTRAVDYIKQTLDDRVTALYNAGRGTEARTVEGVRNKLKEVADDLNPFYKEARAAWAGPSQALDMMAKGRDFVKGEAFYTAREITNMTPADRAFFREGVNQRITDMVKRKKEGADKVADLLRTPAMREKMAATFETPRAYKQWLREMLGEEKMNKTLQQLRGSPTAERLETGSDLSGSVLRDVIWGAKGNPFAQMRMFGHAAKGLKGPPREAVAEALAPVFSMAPAEQQAILQMVQRLTPVAGAQTALPPLAGQLAASQAHRPGMQKAALLPLALYDELGPSAGDVLAR